jgi:hypothetical protein
LTDATGRLGRRLLAVSFGAVVATAFAAPATTLAAGHRAPLALTCGDEQTAGIASKAHVSDRTVGPGQEIGISASCFTPGEVVDVRWDTPAQLLATTEADSQGGAQTTITVPEEATCGTHTITMTGEASGHDATVQVSVRCGVIEAPGSAPPPLHSKHPKPPAVAATGQSTPTALPFTGSPAAPLSATGAALVLLGYATLLTGRRRYIGRHALR